MEIGMSSRYLIAAALASAIALGAHAQGTNAKSGGHAHGGSGSQQMMNSMMDGMKEMQSMKMTGDVDRDFASMMRMHHQKGIEMAQAEIKNGKDEKMKAMARKIAEDQGKEIKQFDEWLASRK
jgi:uncharacterized protein (DUF305 family)